MSRVSVSVSVSVSVCVCCAVMFYLCTTCGEVIMRLVTGGLSLVF